MALVGFSVAAKAQVSNSDSTTNEPKNSAANIIAGTTAKKVSLGIYAQIDYEQPIGGRQLNQGKMDIHRLVLFLGYSFTDKTTFVSEIELEHVKEVFVEQAFVNHNVADWINFRAGLLLIPMGIQNEYHEPTTFNGVERTFVENRIIPSTWREIGAGFAGKFQDLSLKYQLYTVNGFLSYDGEGKLRAEDGLRKGRQKAAKSVFTSPNFAAKIDFYGISGLKLGLATYYGRSQSTMYEGIHKDSTALIYDADKSTIKTTMFGFDGRYQKKAFEARFLVAYTQLGNTENYNVLTGKNLGSEMFGGYVEAGYDVLSLFNPNAKQKFKLFSRYEVFDTQAKVEGQAVREDDFKGTVVTTGISYFLADGAVLKADYQNIANRIGATDHAVNFGVGIWF
ncbi:MAG: hypothetical protein IH948_00985 [Bacteroidetes bacterium]|nr:hypothetical protein [Bacteroidota bacterium]